MSRRPPLIATTSPDRDRRALETRAVHPPELPPQSGDPLAPPLDLTTTYAFDDVDEFAEASRLKTGAGYVYVRWSNPTVDAFEAAVADLERAEAAEAFASGMGAITSTFLALCRSGDRIVSARQLYGGVHAVLDEHLPRYGIEATLCDVDDHDAIEKALDAAALLYCETIGNPRIVMADIDRLAELAHAAGVPLVVDNTFASPMLCRPIERGADIVVHSTTKFIGGHHDLLGGVVCGARDHLEPIVEHNREFGVALAPFNAWLALRGLATLPLRVERSSQSALRIAEMIDAHDAVDNVYYPGLASDPGKPLADRLLGGRGGGMVGFDVAGGRDRARSFLANLDLIKRAASLGGSHSLLVHAASVTHTQLSPEQLAAAGIAEGFCRLSVGLEDASDLVDDLAQALDRSS